MYCVLNTQYAEQKIKECVSKMLVGYLFVL